MSKRKATRAVVDYRTPQAPAPLSVPAGALVIALALIVVITIAIYARGSAALMLLGLLTDGLVACAWLVAMIGIGMALLRTCRIELAESISLRIAAAAGVGIGSVALLVLGLGLLGVMHAAVAWGIIGVGCAVVIIQLVARMRAEQRLLPPRTSPWHALLLALAPVLGIALVAALVPPGVLWGDEPHGYDVLSYHLQVPREWYEAGRIVPLEHNVFSFFPFNVEMHFLLAMHLRGGPWAGMYLAQLMHLAMVAMTVVAIYGFVAHRGAAAAALAATAAGAAPWLLLLGPVAYNEGGLLLFATLTIGLALRGAGGPAPLRTMALAGAMAGFACGSKLTAVPMVLLALPVAIVAANLWNRPPGDAPAARFSLWRGVALYIVLGVATFSPWLVRNAAWAGNPIFPQAAGLLGSAHFSDEQVQRWDAAHAPRADQRSLAARGMALGEQVIWDWRYGYLLLPLALVAGVIARSRESVALLVLLAMQVLVWLFATHLQSRFLVLAIPNAALLIGQFTGVARRVALAGVAIMLIAGVVQWDARYGLSGGGVLPRMAGLGAIKLDDLSPLAPVDVASVPADATLALAGDAQAFLYRRPMSRLRYRTVFDVDARGRSAVDAWVDGEPAEWILIDPPSLARFQQSYLHLPPPPPSTPAAPYLINPR